jgi:Bacterial regulatory proteins, gntR family
MPVTKIVSRLSSTRDLRAEIVALATKLVGNREKARLILQEPGISRATIDTEWQLLQPILNQDVAERLQIEIAVAPKRFEIETAIVLIDKPNWRFEVLRQLLCAAFDGTGPGTAQQLCDRIGASQTPIRSAVHELTLAGLVHAQRRGGFIVKAQELTPESLGKAAALPQTLRFRFERGAIIKSPVQLLARLSQLIGDIPSNDLVPNDWITYSLSGTPVAQHDQPAFDLIGVPRLDMVVRVPRKAKSYDADLIRMLDDGLEPESAVTAHTPVVLTLVRADTVDVRRTGLGVATAHPADVYLSLHDLGMREQAFAYAEAMLP